MDQTSSSALTLAAASQHVGSVMETTIVETCPMNRTVASPPHRQVYRQLFGIKVLTYIY